jgi:hypothetical protein
MSLYVSISGILDCKKLYNGSSLVDPVNKTIL